MSKLNDLFEILKELNILESLIKAQKGTIEFVNKRLKNMNAFDDEERLKLMGEASEHDLKILEPHYVSQKEKFKVLLEAAKTDSKVLSELETMRVPEEYKELFEGLKQELLSQKGYEKSEE